MAPVRSGAWVKFVIKVCISPPAEQTFTILRPNECPGLRESFREWPLRSVVMSDADGLDETHALGALVKTARRRLRMTQRELARVTGVTRQTLGYLENGRKGNATFRTSAKVIATVAHHVGLTPEQLATVGRGDAGDLLGELIEADLIPGEAEQRRVAALVVAGLRSKREEFPTIGEFLGWVLVATGDVEEPDAQQG